MKGLPAIISLLCVLFFGLLPDSGHAALGDIVTVAGGGVGDNGAATASSLANPFSVATDNAGNLYIADSGNNRIRRVSAGTGIITTVAGTGLPGFSGDGGAATAASVFSPKSVAVDNAGNLYIADTNNGRIRKVSAGTGTISTVAGNGTFAYSGDGGAAIAAGLYYPTGVAVDSAGNLYIADTYNDRIRKVSAGTGIITTVAGSGTSGFSGDNGAATVAQISYPKGVVVDGSGNLYIADSNNSRIRKVSAGAGIITTVAGGGSAGLDDNGAATAAFVSPAGVTVDGAGNLYIADDEYNRIRKVSAATGIITTVAGSGPGGYSGDNGAATSASLSPSGVTADNSGNLYIADSVNQRIRKVDAGTGIITTVAGCGSAVYMGDNGAATAASLSPSGIAMDGAGNLYITDTLNSRVRKVDAKTRIITTVAGNGTSGYSGDNGAATSASLNAPSGVAADSAGNLYIADQGNNRIRKVDVGTGVITTVAGNGVLVMTYLPGQEGGLTGTYSGDNGAATAAGLNSPAGVALDGAGNLYIADWGNARIRKVDAQTGIITTVAGGGSVSLGDNGAATAVRIYASDLAVDSIGNLYIADDPNVCIRKVSAGTGVITTVAGGGSAGIGDNGAATAATLKWPTGVVLDNAGNLYFSDRNTGRVRRVDAGTGIITTVAGGGLAGLGDNGAATAATLYAPSRVVMDRAGNIFIADRYRVREVIENSIPGVPTGVFATAGNGQATVYCTAVSNGGSAITGYTVTSTPGNITFTGTSSPLTVTGLSNGTPYSFTVVATNTAGSSALSAASSSVTPSSAISLTVPGVPTGVSAAAGNAQATLSFSAPALTGDSAIAGYSVTSTPGNITATGAASPLTVTGLTNGISYSFAVAAINAAGTGAPSAPSGSVTPANVPDAPTAVSALGGNAQATVSFSAPAFNGGSAITGYTVTSAPGNLTATGTASPLTVTGLDNGTLYSFTVTATNVAGTGAPSAASPGVTPITVPGAPSGVTASAGNAEATVSFSAPASNGGSTITGYTVTSTPGNLTATGTGSPIKVRLLNNGTSYTFTVTAKNAAGTGVPSAASPGVIPVAVPGSSTVMTATAALGDIVTIAGGGAGDNGAATLASLAPAGVALDSIGNLYVADVVNQRIRKIAAATGVISTVAGNGSQSYAGDNGPATAASLNSPSGVAVTSSGDLYIADQGNNRIRKVSAGTGIITTVAGNGMQGYSGDNGPAIAAYLNSPEGVAVDVAGNLFIADRENHRIREVSAETGIITTVAGNGTQGYLGDNGPATAANLNFPAGVALSSTGDLYIADSINCRVRRVSAGTGTITTVAGNGATGYSGDNGAATAASLNYIFDLTLDSAGNLYITDPGNYRVRQVSAETGIITTVAGNGGQSFTGTIGDNGAATAASFSIISGVAVDGAGNLYIADQGNYRIREVSAATGIITTMAGNGSAVFKGDDVDATTSSLSAPSGVAVDSFGNLYITDTNNGRIRKVDAETKIITTVAGHLSPSIGGFYGDNGAATAAYLFMPAGVAVDSAGNLYIADTDNGRIRKVAAETGIIATVAGNGGFPPNANGNGDGGPATAASLSDPNSIALDGAGNLYFVDGLRIRKVDSGTGIISTVAGGGSGGWGDNGPATAASLNYPSSVAVDSAGNLYIADTDNNSIRKVDAGTGIISTVAGGSSATLGDNSPATAAYLSAPSAVAVDRAGNLYIAEGNNRIRKVDAGTGILCTVAGTGISGLSGDNGPATAAKLNSPAGLALDNAGNLYIADKSNNRVREVIENIIPGAPAGVFATAGSARGTVFFTSPAPNGGSAVTGFTVTATPGNITVVGTGSPLTVTGLTNGTSYSFTVMATNSAGTGALSAASSEVIPSDLIPVKVPGVPTGVTATAGNAQAMVSFNAPDSSGDSAIAGYTVTSTPGNVTATGTASPITVTGLTNGTLYSFTVVAINAAGTSAASVASATVVYEIAPGAPTEVTAVVGNAQATVSFSAPASDGGSAILGYTVTSTPGNIKTTGTGSPITVTGLGIGMSFSFSVTATNAVGTGAPSLASQAVTIPVTVPGSPTGVTATAGNSQVTVSFSTPAFDGGSGITSYTVASNPGNITATGSASPVTVTGLSNGTSYSFTVTATNLAGTGPPSLASSFVVPATVAFGIGSITSVAGNGGQDYSGDNGSATAAKLGYPADVAVDRAGNFYIVDRQNNSVRKVSAGTGIITTVAGNGTAGFSGDGGAATAAQLTSPMGVAVDGVGNLYIADTWNNLIRMVAAGTGTISTVAGGGTAGLGDNGPATAARLGYPAGVAIDSVGNLYIADTINNRIREVSAGTGVITTVAGGGSTGLGDDGPATAAELQYPAGVGLDGAGDLYVADSGNNRIRKLSAGTGIITTVAGGGSTGLGDGGPATAGSLASPSGLALDSVGNLYIADTYNNRIRKVAAGTGIITTVAGIGSSAFRDSGVAGAVSLNSPQGVAVDSAGNVYIADTNNHRVLEVMVNSLPEVIAAPGGGTYGYSQAIILTANLPATIYYTLDGSDPTTSSTRRSFPGMGQLTITATTTLKYFAIDSQGNISQAVTQVYVITPAVPPSAPIGVSALAGNAQATVSFTSTQPRNGGNAIGGTTFTVTSSPGNLTASGTDSPIIVRGLTNGTPYTFTVAGTNSAGTGAASEASASVTPLAPIPPVLTISTATDQAGTSNAVLNVSGTAVVTRGSLSSVTLNGRAVATSPIDGSFSFPVVLSTGANSLMLVATDNAGLTSTITRTVTLDSALPAFSIGAPADNSTIQANFIDVTGTADADATVIITANGTAAQSVNRSGAAFTSTVTLAPGMNTIEVAVSDAVTGVVGTGKRTVTCNSGQSLLAVTDPAQDILIKRVVPGTAGSYLVQGTASNPLSPLTVTITANGVSYPQQLSGGAYSQLLSFPIAQSYQVVVSATDANGNRTTTQRNVIYAGSATGNIDGYDSVSVSDALLALRIAVGLVATAPEYLDNLDVAPLVNGYPQPDGKIDIADALQILRKCVKLSNW